MYGKLTEIQAYGIEIERQDITNDTGSKNTKRLCSEYKSSKV